MFLYKVNEKNYFSIKHVPFIFYLGASGLLLVDAGTFVFLRQGELELVDRTVESCGRCISFEVWGSIPTDEPALVGLSDFGFCFSTALLNGTSGIDIRSL